MDKEKEDKLQKIAAEMNAWGINLLEMNPLASAGGYVSVPLSLVGEDALEFPLLYEDKKRSYKCRKGKKVIGVILGNFAISLENFGEFEWDDHRKLCCTYNLGGYQWDMPTAAQLKFISENKARLNEVLDCAGGEKILGKTYWSSDAYDASRSAHINFDFGGEYKDWHFDTTKYICRAVLNF